MSLSKLNKFYSNFILLFCIIISFGMIYSCIGSSKILYQINSKERTPPNTIFVNDTLLVDRTEISNIDWKEFMYFQNRVYGKESDEHIRSYPDTVSLLEIGFSDSTVYQIGYKEYHNNFVYDKFPAIGITLEQAKAYSKWRSDVVFYMNLIEIDYCKPDTLVTVPETIQMYFENFETIPENKRLEFYPEYFIPTKAHWEVVKSLIKNKELSIGPIQSSRTLKFNLDEHGAPFQPNEESMHNIDTVLFNVLGSVAELTDTENIAFGGSSKDKYVDIREMSFDTIDASTDLIGFRNFCRLIKTADMVYRYKQTKVDSITN